MCFLLFITRDYSFDSVKEQDGRIPRNHPATTPEYLALQYQPGIPAHELRLKSGCVCALMCNLDVNNGLVKNRRVVVEALHEKIVKIRLIESTIPSVVTGGLPVGKNLNLNGLSNPNNLTK